MWWHVISSKIAVQDDAHIFCTPQQIMPEIEQLLCLVEDILGKFGFSQFEVNLSTRPEDSIGSDEVWATAEGALRDALNSKEWKFTVDEGGGAFYGPKIDIKIQVCSRICTCDLAGQLNTLFAVAQKHQQGITFPSREDDSTRH